VRRRLAICAILALSCGGSEEKHRPPPAPPAAPQATKPAPPPAPPAAPASPAAAPDAKRGAALYATYCASCHGPQGNADGPAGAALNPRPARHSDGAYMNALSNEHLFKVVKEGGQTVGKSPLMAPWGGTLTDAQIWDVVAFVRSLAKPPYPGTVP
jgi:mono/diheme cytochrome c family protein